VGTDALSVEAFVESYLADIGRHLRSVPADALVRAGERLLRAYAEGAQVLVAGNGGSASTASHLACDLGKTALGADPRSDSTRFRIVSLADNVALLTAWANDHGYELVFAEQVRMLGRAGDILIVVSASGRSPNIVAAVRAAQERGLGTIGLLGFDGGVVKDLVDEAIVVDCDDFGHVESIHLVLGHLLTEWLSRHIRELA
jgi:D-sedoheptulose 7-phosphate isomerase